MTKGVIALDIDGTITYGLEEVSPEVIAYLNTLVEEGWQIVFITGRTFALAEHVLRVLTFPYLLAVYNGALIIEMPSQTVVQRLYLTKDELALFHPISVESANDCVVYTGWENADRCYYRPAYFESELWEYAQHRQQRKLESWEELEQFENLPVDAFPSVKYFGRSPQIDRLCHRIEERLGLHAPLCYDGIYKGYGIAQVTHAGANKGAALLTLAGLSNAQVTIAAGDGGNDASMLQVANIRVVMQNAPASILKLADIVAPPAEAHGIISGLRQAVLVSGI